MIQDRSDLPNLSACRRRRATPRHIRRARWALATTLKMSSCTDVLQVIDTEAACADGLLLNPSARPHREAVEVGIRVGHIG